MIREKILRSEGSADQSADTEGYKKMEVVHLTDLVMALQVFRFDPLSYMISCIPP